MVESNSRCHLSKICGSRSKYRILIIFFVGISCKVPDILHDERRQKRESFEDDYISEKYPNLGIKQFLRNRSCFAFYHCTCWIVHDWWYKLVLLIFIGLFWPQVYLMWSKVITLVCLSVRLFIYYPLNISKSTY